MGSYKNSLTTYLTNYTLCVYFLSAMIFLTYSSSCFSVYGYVDDYSYLRSGYDTMRQNVEGGRPISGYVIIKLFHLVHTVDGLRFVRLFGLIGLIIFSVTVFNLLRASILSVPMSWLCSLIAAMLPPFQVYVGWAVLCLAPYAAAMALVSCYLIWKEESDTKVYIFSFALLLLSILIYQPSTMSFVAFIPIGMYRNHMLNRKILGNDLARAAIVFFFTLLVAFIFIKISPYLFYNGEKIARTALAFNLIEKLKWFVSEPLPHAESLLVIPYFQNSNILLGTFLVVMLVGSGVFGKNRWIALIVFLALIPISYLPNLVIKESWASNRTLVGLELLSLFIWTLALEQTSLLIKKKYDVGTIVMFLAAIYGVISASRNITQEFAQPNSIEWSYAVHSARKFSGVESVCVKRSDWSDSLARFYSYDDFGIPAGFALWSSTAIVSEAFHYINKPSVHVVPWGVDVKCQYVVDMSYIKTYKFMAQSR